MFAIIYLDRITDNDIRDAWMHEVKGGRIHSTWCISYIFYNFY